MLLKDFSVIKTTTSPACRPELATVALIEDDVVLNQRMIEMLDSSQYLSFSFASTNILDGLQKLKQYAPDVLLLDLGLPDGSGIDAIHYVNDNALPTGVIILSAFDDEKHVVEAISAGAVGYLLKAETHQSIETSILQMLSGGSPISPKIARDLLGYFRQIPSGSDPQVETVDEGIRLTKREKEILTKIAKGFTCKEISEMECLSYHTIATHVRNIYKKLSVSSRAGAVFEAYNLRLI